MKDEVIENKQYWDSLIKAFLEKHKDVKEAEVVEIFGNTYIRSKDKNSRKELYPLKEE